METTGFVFGLFGFFFGILAYLRINALEKKLRETGVLDKNFNSEKEV